MLSSDVASLGVGLVAARNPDATMMVLPSDQLINDTAAYQSVMRDALTAATHNDALVTVGIKPTWACPAFGYIERGEPATLNGPTLDNTPCEVTRFREKPNPELAETFLAQGNFAWNAGMFIWSVKTVINELTQHTPELADFIEEIGQSTNIINTVADKFPSLTPISIDYALMENASRVLNIEATFDWDDVGSWLSVAKYLDTQGNGNQTNTVLAEIDAQNNIVFNARKDSKIALLGVDDLIVVQTDDALLIANRHQADDIKNLGPQLPDNLL